VIASLISFLPLGAAGIDLRADVDARVFAFALSAALTTALLFSLAPAIRASRARPSSALKEESATIGAGMGMRKLLVIGQIALALVLLIGAGLFVRTLASLRAKGPGFDTTNQLTVRVDPLRNGYPQQQATMLMRNLLGRLRTVPEVEAVGISVAELLGGGSWNQQVTFDTPRRFLTDGVVHCNAVSAGFFAALGVRPSAGRDFTDRDAQDTASMPMLGAGATPFRTAIVNESLARRYFGNSNPIGAHLGLGNQPDTRTTIEIVGVVPTFSYRGLRETDDQAFFPVFDAPATSGTFWIRTRVPSAAAISVIRAAVREVDPALPIERIQTADERLDRSLVNERLLASLASAFAGLAILLALVGVYGLMSFVVSRRTREIGIRVALGATRGAAVWLILRDAALMLAVGVAIAIPAVWGLGRLIESQLFGVRVMDAPTVLGAAVLIGLGALGASALPVRRATAIDPMQALRHD
jgi:predicted permease